MKDDGLIIGFVCDARGAEPTYFLEMLHSLTLQGYSGWDLQLATNPAELARMEGILQDYEQRESRMIVHRAVDFPVREKLLPTLAKHSRADFVMVIDKHDYLAHDALFRITSMLVDKPHLQRIVGECGTFDASGAFGKAFAAQDQLVLVKQSLFRDGHDAWAEVGDSSLLGYIPTAIRYRRVEAALAA